MNRVWEPVRRLLAGTAIALALAAPAASAQRNRTAMVDSARALIEDFNERQSIGLLRRALNPALGPPDVSWARAVQLLGQSLWQTNQRDEALSWFRWAWRQSPSTAVDSVNFIPAVVNAFVEAREFVTAGRSEPRATVRFEWSSVTTGAGLGSIVVAREEARAAPSLKLSVNGEFLAEKQTRRLSAGSYHIAARVAGQPDAEFATEVLPGVTTIVTLNLASTDEVLSHATTAIVFERLARVNLPQRSRAECRVGFFAGRPGLLVTRYTKSVGSGPFIVKLVRPGVAPDTLSGIAASDTVVELMALATSFTGGDSLPVAANARTGMSLWTAHFPKCGEVPSLVRASVFSVTGDSIVFAEDVRGADQSGLVVDAGGGVVGLLTGPRNARMIGSTAVVIASARSAIDTRTTLAAREITSQNAPPQPAASVTPARLKRRSRLLPIVGGVAVAGLAAVLAMPKSGPKVTTGGIVIVLP